MPERTVKVRLTGDISDYSRAMLEAEAETKGLSKELNTTSGRMAILTQSALALGPALVPIGATAVPAMAGLANQLGISVAAAGVGILAFKGLGKALDAVNKAQIDPTATNLANMNRELSQLGPSGQDFVLFLQKARPELQHLQELARAGLLPGLEQGLGSLSGLLPDVERVITTISSTLGELASEAGGNLNTAKWREFIAFLDSDARPTLLAMGRTLGNFAEGFANLWMAFAPLSSNFSQGFLGMARDFAKWTDGLDQTQGFQDFLAYVDKNGPVVLETLGSLGDALLQIVEAAAPIGADLLPVIKDFADAISALADSDLGPVIFGVASLAAALTRLKAVGVAVKGSSLAAGLFGPAGFGGAAKAAADLPAATRAYLTLGSTVDKTGYKLGQFSATSERLGTSLKGTAKIAGAGAGLAFAMSGIADKAGLSNTVMGAMAGSVLPGVGTAAGAAAGAILDLRSQTDLASQSAGKFEQAFANAGSLDKQAAVIAEFKRQLSALEASAPSGFGGEIGKLKDVLGELQSKQADGVKAAQDAAFAEANLSGQMSGASQAARDEMFALLQNAQAKNRTADATLNAFSAETNYRQALKDAAAQARNNNAGINGSSDAALKNRAALSQVASAWNAVADAGKASQKDMVTARSNFIKVAQAMGLSNEQAVALADSLLHMPSPKPTVDVNDKATPKVSALQDRINRLHGKTVTINTRYTYTNAGNAARDKASVRTGRGNATGGFITGPGTTTSDEIPAWLSNKEYVMRASSVEKYGVKMMDSINAGTYAGGGLVQRMPTTGPGSHGGTAWSDNRALEDLIAALPAYVERGVQKGLHGAELALRADSRTLQLHTAGVR